MFNDFFKIHPLNDKEKKKGLWAISWICFFWSLSSLMVFAILPVFLIDVLGVSYIQAGAVEGIAYFAAFIFKVFSGIISDIFRNRKPLIFIGSVLTVLVKLLYFISNTFTLIFIARFVDRLSKGIRSSPTDALIADLSSSKNHGSDYGLRQTLYTLGAVAGALTAMILIQITENDYRFIFAASMIPSFIALLIVFFYIKQPPILGELKKPSLKWQLKDISYLPSTFWVILGISFVLMLARFSESFITYRAKSIGWSIETLPLLIVIMDLTHALLAYPAGKIADKVSRRQMLLFGILFLILTNIIFICTDTCWGVTIGTIFNGIHMGITQGLLAALIAEYSPSDLRGTAFALYYLSTGFAVLIGNTLAGFLADSLGTMGSFCGGFVFSSLSAILLYSFIRKQHRSLVPTS